MCKIAWKYFWYLYEASVISKICYQSGARYHAGANGDELYESYASFGEDPYIVPEPEGKHFSAWEYAKQRCRKLCAPGDH